MSRIFLIADSRSRVSPQDLDVINRHKLYLTALNRFPGYEDSTLLIIQPSIRLFRNVQTDFEKLSIQKLSIFGLLGFGFSLRKNKILPSGIIAGDPWVSFLFAQLIRRLSFTQGIPLQVQFHAELSEKWVNTSVLNKLKFKALPYVLKRSESIRLVSKDQEVFLSDVRNFQREKTVCIPVPLNGEISTQFRMNTRSNRVIAFVGRIQTERNVELFVELVGYFISRDPSIAVYVIGDGPEFDFLKIELGNISGGKIEFFGHLSARDLTKTWKKISVLISTAPTESYGRAMREALCNGTSVLALKSSGSVRLMSECTTGVELFTEIDSLQSIYTKLQKLFFEKPNYEFIEYQSRLESSIPGEIANSWVTMATEES